MSSWSEQRRLDKAADAEQRRKDQDAAAERALKLRAADAEQRREERQADKAERRAEQQQKRRDKRERRRERAQAWKAWKAPKALYDRGTVALVTASVLAGVPAQIRHFAGVSLWLVTLPFAIEGAAWVAAFGVMYADEQKLPAWVRWLLRGLCLSAAGYAAWINYQYGMQTAPSVGYGLAAVSLLGPAFFELRQWVTTLTFDPAEKKRRGEAKARAKHEKRRYRDHKDVVKLARRLVSAAAYNTLAFEDAFVAAWEIKYGTRIPGMTPELHAEKLASSKALAEAMDAANGSPVSTRGRLLQLLHPAPPALLQSIEKPQVVSQIPPSSGGPSEGQLKAVRKGARTKPVPPVRRKGDSLPFHPAAKAAAAETARKVMAVNGHR